MALDVSSFDEEANAAPTPKKDESAEMLALKEQALKQQKELEEMKKMISDLAKAKSGNSAPNNGGTLDVATAIISEMKKRTDAEKYSSEGNNYITEDEIDPNDHLEEGVRFYSHSGGYFIIDDKRNGHPVPTPFRNVITFNHLSTTRSGEGKNIKVENVSMYVSSSKKEVEWLKNSSFYGKHIFSDFQIAKSSHAKLASAINRILGGVRTMDKNSFFTSCKAMNIPMSRDLESMRLQYVQIMAEKEVQAQEEQSLFRAKNALIERELIGAK